MRKSKFTEEQMIGFVKQAEAGNPPTTKCTGLLRPLIIFLSDSMNSGHVQSALMRRTPETAHGIDRVGR